MRDAPGQLAECLHFLRLRELLLGARKRLLGFAPFADVAGDHCVSDQRAGLVADRLDDDARPEHAFVASHPPAFGDVLALVGGDLQGARRLATLLFLLGVEAAEVLTDDLARRVVMDPLRTRVPVGDVAFGIEHEDRVVGHALNEQAEPPFAFRQRLLRFTALGEILHQRGLDVFPLFDLGIEDVVRLLERGSPLQHDALEIIARAPQIFLRLTARGDILGTATSWRTAPAESRIADTLLRTHTG